MKNVLRSVVVCMVVCMVCTSAVYSQSLNVTLNQDPFFGFYPSVGGSSKINESVDFTYYGIFWTSPGLGDGVGSNLWTEFGVGANFKTLDGKLEINPSLGTTHGRLQSTGSRGVPFEGLVPSLTANLNTESLEGQLYAGYYLALRERANAQNNFLHYWIHGGYKISSLVSAGLHLETLNATAIPRSGTSATNRAYTWYGTYVQFTSKGGHTFRLTAGGAAFGPTSASESGEFYKMSLGIPFKF